MKIKTTIAFHDLHKFKDLFKFKDSTILLFVQHKQESPKCIKLFKTENNKIKTTND